MTDIIDETTITAWLDGELDEAGAARVAAAVATDPELAALAQRHRRMKERFAASFGALAEEPVAQPSPPPVISFATAQAKRAAAKATPRRWFAMGGSIAASLIVGVLVGQELGSGTPAKDATDMLALSAPLSHALDSQLSGDPGTVRVALSFQDHNDRYCRSFDAPEIAGVACKSGGTWQLRYATAAPNGQPQGEYRMAGTDPVQGQVIDSMIAGEPLNRAAEEEARSSSWRK